MIGPLSPVLFSFLREMLIEKTVPLSKYRSFICFNPPPQLLKFVKSYQLETYIDVAGVFLLD